MLILKKSTSPVLIMIAAVCMALLTTQVHASFGGKIKNVRIKERNHGSYSYRVVVNGGDFQAVDSAQIYFEKSDLVVNNPVMVLPRISNNGKNMIISGQFQAASKLPEELPLGISLFDKEKTLLLSQSITVPVEARPSGRIVFVSLKQKSTGEHVYDFYTTAPSLEAFKELFAISDMSKLGYMEAKEISEESFLNLKPESFNYATGAFDPYGNLIRYVSEDGIVLTFEQIDAAKMDAFKLGGDWNRSYRSGYRPKNKGYKSKSGTITINIYESGSD